MMHDEQANMYMSTGVRYCVYLCCFICEIRTLKSLCMCNCVGVSICPEQQVSWFGILPMAAHFL